MATKKPRTRRKSGGVSKRHHTAQGRAKAPDAPLAGMKGAERRQIGHVQLEVGRAGAARVKRMIYPAGFRWSVDMKPIVGRAPRHDNVWFAFGHAHHGLTLGAVTGRLIAEMMSGETPFLDARPDAHRHPPGPSQ